MTQPCALVIKLCMNITPTTGPKEGLLSCLAGATVGPGGLALSESRIAEHLRDISQNGDAVVGRPTNLINGLLRFAGMKTVPEDTQGLSLAGKQPSLAPPITREERTNRIIG